MAGVLFDRRKHTGLRNRVFDPRSSLKVWQREFSFGQRVRLVRAGREPGVIWEMSIILSHHAFMRLHAEGDSVH